MDLPRQPQPVRIDFSGDLRDVEVYIQKLMRILSTGRDDVTRLGNQIRIYPAAVND